MTAPNERNVAQLLVSCSRTRGVEYVFGLPGEENLQVIDAIASSSIRFITTRDERGAAFMADTYGALTGRAGVCLSTLGPVRSTSCWALPTPSPTHPWSRSRRKPGSTGCTRSPIRWWTCVPVPTGDEMG